MANTKNCWYCDYFTATGPNNQGECRRYAPAGLDTNLISADGDRTVPFPVVYNGVDEWCGDFKQARGPVPVPPA